MSKSNERYKRQTYLSAPLVTSWLCSALSYVLQLLLLWWSNLHSLSLQIPYLWLGCPHQGRNKGGILAQITFVNEITTAIPWQMRIPCQHCLMMQMSSASSRVQSRTGSVPQGAQDAALGPGPLNRKSSLCTASVSSSMQIINPIVLGCLLLKSGWKATKSITKTVFSENGTNRVVSIHLQSYTDLQVWRKIDVCLGCLQPTLIVV